jgi:flagellar M-ring protein FliF
MLEESLDPDKAESELLKERIMNLVQSDSKKAAYALNQWIDERRAAS